MSILPHIKNIHASCCCQLALPIYLLLYKMSPLKRGKCINFMLGAPLVEILLQQLRLETLHPLLGVHLCSIIILHAACMNITSTTRVLQVFLKC